MNANVENRGDCTGLMEAAIAGRVNIVRLLIAHGADVNAQSTLGNTPLMYGCAGGHEEVVRVLLEAGANVEDHNENGHTPLMEAASAGHVQVAKILLEHGAGINTHSNEFKESALTLACYKGHLEMVRFLLEAGADQEHKTDEMHTALMEASMDGHVEVARLLLDSGAQVNMPTDSFESPLTLAACGGHVDLAMLLIERGANIEEVNDEGYTPLMEAAREGHEEMVALLLSQGANINAQTEETQETALTLACCGGFLEVADFLIKAGADIELGASTPLMEAAQEGHLDLVRYLLESAADVHAQTQTEDTALTYACENGHTDVADLLLQFGADLEHESEGGRTPLMKACRARHLCTVQFLISKRADVNRQTTNNDHTPLSLACAGGHLAIVELLLAQSANPFHKLKDNSTMLIEAAKGGHTAVVQLLLDYPHSIMMSAPHSAASAPMLLPQHQQQQQTTEQQTQNLQLKHNTLKSLLRKNRSVTMMPDMSLTSAEAQQVRSQPAGEPAAITKDDTNILDKGSGGFTSLSEPNISLSPTPTASTQGVNVTESQKNTRQEQILHKQQILEELQRIERELQIKGAGHLFTGPRSSIVNQSQQQDPSETETLLPAMLNIDLPSQSTSHGLVCSTTGMTGNSLTYQGTSDAALVCSAYIDSKLMGMQGAHYPKMSVAPTAMETFPTDTFPSSPPLSLASLPATTATMPLITTSSTTTPSPPSISTSPTIIAVSQSPITASSDVSQNTAISDRPKAKPVSKKEGKNIRKATSGMGMAKLQLAQAIIMGGLQQQYQQKQRQHPSYQVQQVQQLQQLNQLQLQLDQVQIQQSQQPQRQPQQSHQQPHSQQQTNVIGNNTNSILMPTQLMMSHLHPTHHHLHSQQPAQEILSEQMDPEAMRKYKETPACAYFTGAQKSKTFSTNERVLKLEDGTDIPIDDAFEIFPSINFDDAVDTIEDQEKLELKRLDMSNNKEQQQQQQQQHLQTQIVQQSGSSHVTQEYFTNPVLSVPSVSLSTLPSLQVTSAGVQIEADISAGLQLTSTQSLQNPALKNRLRAFEEGFRQGSIHFRECMQHISSDTFQPQLLLQSSQITFPTQTLPAVSGATGIIDSIPPHQSSNYAQSTTSTANQVQVATQTQAPATTTSSNIATVDKKQVYTAPITGKSKKTRYPLLSQQQSCQQQQTASAQQTSNFPTQSYQLDPATVGGYTTNQVPPAPFSCMDVNSETDSNHDTALTLVCAGGHEDLVELLLSRGADIEHRDKKGFTPLILAATAGHQKVVDILLNHGADIEAQSECTKDTPLSLACSGGRYEVVELLLNRGANKEHRNVSDYTPLSLAASGGYVNIIKLLLSHGAEINSRTGSKLGISPLMLAAMNGHTAAVKLLLDMGSDINAQIETNRNTALTLACFQGRHEVVSLLLDRKANVEHRAKTGLTPLMEAASGGYVEVGRVLLSKGADVNATPVPSSRDTALTIAADKGHCRFVELLLTRGTQVEVKNKKGNSPLWLAANGGHLSVVDLLHHAGADIDSQDNRKVSCLMAAFRKGHIKVVKWMVNHVTQFPSDQEMTRYIATVSDKELLEKCQECVKVIRAAKETQAAKANKNATILLEELDMEKTREESKKAAAARRRERKKKKKLEKKEEKRKLHEEYKKNETAFEDKEENGKKSGDEECDRVDDSEHEGGDERMETVPSPMNRSPEDPDREEGDSGIDANSQGSCSSNDVKAREKKKDKKKKKNNTPNNNDKNTSPQRSPKTLLTQNNNLSQNIATSTKSQNNTSEKRIMTNIASAVSVSTTSVTTRTSTTVSSDRKLKGQLVFESSRHPADREDFEATGNETYVPGKGKKSYNNQYDGDALNTLTKISNTSPKQGGKREEGWKEVVRKGQSDDSGRFMNSPFRSKKVSVPPNAISRVIGRGGSNINAIRVATGAHIEVEKQSKCQGERIITIKGSSEATKHAHALISLLIKDPEADILQVLSKSKLNIITTSSWDKTITVAAACKAKVGSVNKPSNLTSSTANNQVNKPGYPSGVSTVSQLVPLRSSSTIKLASAFSTSLPRATAPRLVAAEKRAQAVAAQMASSSNTKTTMSYTSAIMTAGRAGTKIVATNTTQTFAAKLSEITASTHSSTTVMQSTHVAPVNKQQKPGAQVVTVMSAAATVHTTNNQQQQQSIISTSPKHCRSLPTLSVPPAISGYPGKSNYPPGTSAILSSATSTVAMTNCSESSIVSTSTNSIRMTSSPPVSSQTQTLPPPSPAQQQQTVRSTTPIVMQEQQQHQQQQQLPNSTPLEYSLFNDTFTKVTQQSMWGGRENETQKGMNFATVAGGGVSSNTGSNSSAAKFDSSPPQVDASKAPGYRGATMCSPVSSKPGITGNSSANIIGNVVSCSVQNNPMQSAQYQSSTSYSEHPLPNKPPGGLAVARPVMPQQSIDMGTNMAAAQYNRPTVFQGDLTSRTATTHQPAAHVIPSSTSQPGLDVGLFKTNNAGGYEHPNSNLLKMVPNENQGGAGHPLLPFHPHMQSFAQTIAPATSVINTTVSMSRLNPRAPDFSSSLHLSNKSQVMFNPATGSALHPANMFTATVPAPPPSAMQSNNLAMLGNFPLGKYQAPSRATPAANTGISTTAQTRWPFAPAPHTNYPPHQDPMMSQIGFSNHLANIGGQPGGSGIDLITSLENGGSPAISPTSSAQVTQEMNQLKIEDRKVPRPIGTERATWKNYSAANMGPGGDADTISWMLNDKISWSNLAPSIDRHQIFRSNSTYNQRMPNVDPELHQMMESTFQGHVDTQQPYPANGNTAALSLMPNLALLPGQFGTPGLAEIPPNEPNKIDPPAWGMPDAVQDKQHQTWTKWAH